MAYALSRYTDAYRINMERELERFKDWARQFAVDEVTPLVVNAYITTILAKLPSPSSALTFRASVCRLADVYDIDRPVNRLTFILMKSIEYHHKAGGRMTLTDVDVKNICSIKNSYHRQLLLLLLSTGLRPSELCQLKMPMINFTHATLYTGSTKYAPQGRWIKLCTVACRAASALKPFISPDGFLITKSDAALKELKAALRGALCTDPNKPLAVSLYACRHWFCTRLWQLGCSSAFIMAQMNHKSWYTTQYYIHTDDAVVPWRDRFTPPSSDDVVEETDLVILFPTLWLPRAAKSPEIIPPPNFTTAWLNKRRLRPVIPEEDSTLR